VSFKSAATELRAKTVTDAELSATLKWFDTNGTQLLDYNEMARQIYGEDISTEKLVLPRLKDSKKMELLADTLNSCTYGTTIGAGSRSLSLNSLVASAQPNIFGVKSSTQEKNLEMVENPSVKLARIKMKRIKILTEKAKVEKKIQSIDEQKKKILEEFKERHAK
jgi:hypothetical protein